VKQLWEKVKALKPYRANERYNEVRGNLLSSGIAYYAFFSVFPAFAIAAVIFGFVLRGRPELLDSVGNALNQALPGFVKTATNPTGLITLQEPQLSLLTIGGIVALVSLVLSGIGWIGSFRDGIRASLGAQGSPGNVLTDKLRDLGVFVAFGSAFLVSAVLTSVIGAAADWVAQRIGLGSNTVVVTVVGILVGFAVDVGILVLLLRVLSGVSLPWSVVRQAALVGGALLGIVKIFGLELIGNATKSPLLGSVAIVIGLLFWLNLIARIVLLSACWAYLDVADETAEAAEETDVADGAEAADGAPVEGGAGGTQVQHTTVRLIPPSTAAAGVVDPAVARSRDRVAVAAGAVIGAALATGVAGLLRRRSSR
jgi:membrane protein